MPIRSTKHALALVVSLGISLATAWTTADTVTLKDGSKIMGDVQRASGGKLQVKTAFAGSLQIDLEKIDSWTTAEPVSIALEDGNVFVGPVTVKDGATTVATPHGVVDISTAPVKAIWGQGEPNPMVVAAREQTRKWTYKLGFDLSGKTGNTESLAMGGKAQAILKGPDDRLEFYLGGRSSKENGERTVDEVIGGIDFECNQADSRHLWYARIELENDRIEGLDLRTTAALGYGYYFYKDDPYTLRGRIGAVYRHESYEDGRTESTPAIELALHQRWAISDWGLLTTDISYSPSLENFGDYLVKHETTLALPLAKSEHISLVLGIQHDYTSTPVQDKERMDTFYFSRLQLDY